MSIRETMFLPAIFRLIYVGLCGVQILMLFCIPVALLLNASSQAFLELDLFLTTLFPAIGAAEVLRVLMYILNKRCDHTIWWNRLVLFLSPAVIASFLLAFFITAATSLFEMLIYLILAAYLLLGLGIFLHWFFSTKIRLSPLLDKMLPLTVYLFITIIAVVISKTRPNEVFYTPISYFYTTVFSLITVFVIYRLVPRDDTITRTKSWLVLIFKGLVSCCGVYILLLAIALFTSRAYTSYYAFPAKPNSGEILVFEEWQHEFSMPLLIPIKPIIELHPKWKGRSFFYNVSTGQLRKAPWRHYRPFNNAISPESAYLWKKGLFVSEILQNNSFSVHVRDSNNHIISEIPADMMVMEMLPSDDGTKVLIHGEPNKIQATEPDSTQKLVWDSVSGKIEKPRNLNRYRYNYFRNFGESRIRNSLMYFIGESRYKPNSNGLFQYNLKTDQIRKLYDGKKIKFSASGDGKQYAICDCNEKNKKTPHENCYVSLFSSSEQKTLQKFKLKGNCGIISLQPETNLLLIFKNDVDTSRNELAVYDWKGKELKKLVFKVDGYFLDSFWISRRFLALLSFNTIKSSLGTTERFMLSNTYIIDMDKQKVTKISDVINRKK